MRRPLNLEVDCGSPQVEQTAATTLVRCRFGDGRAATLHFDRDSHLLIRQDIQLHAHRCFTAPGADVTYTAERVRINDTIADRVFQPAVVRRRVIRNLEFGIRTRAGAC